MGVLRGFAPVALFLSVGSIALFAQAPFGLSTRDVVVDGHHLAFHVLPGRLPALVLDAGGGADSS
jgi:hypothetical protein